MAEVKIEIVAEDKASAELGKLGAAAEAASEGVGVLAEALSRASSLASGMELKVEAEAAMASVQGLSSALGALELSRTLSLDVSGALAGASAVLQAIEAIPEVSYKTVVIQYMTQASPVRPFTEGIEYIRQKMESLPTEGSYKVRFEGGVGSGAGGGSSNGGGSFSPTINISAPQGGDTATLAREIDRQLASLWKYGRSELRRAMAG